MRSQPRSYITPEDVRAELDDLERRHGVPSDRRREAFGDDPCASDELQRWSALYEAWQAIEPTTQAPR